MVYLKIPSKTLSNIFNVLIWISFSIEAISSFNCYTFINSTCSYDMVTEWNTKDIGKILTNWFKSISIENYKKDAATTKNLNGINCKTLSLTENHVFLNMDPETYSPEGVTLGKVLHDDDDGGISLSPKERKFVGPVWATLNDLFDWDTDIKEGAVHSLKAERHNLHNGLYHGALNNTQMRIGITS